MSLVAIQPVEQGETSDRSNSAARWQRAIERARRSNVRVMQLAGSGQWIVTSATNPSVAYETDGQNCTCIAAQLYGDPVCLHRAALLAHLSPTPQPPAHQAYDPDTEALQWAYNDRERAHRDLDRLNRKLSHAGALNERDYASFLFAQKREQDASARIAELTSKIAKVSA